MPTMLGNILRNGEDYAGSRYGLDALTAYPRMSAGMCVCFGGSALATAPLVLRMDGWSAVPAVLLLLAVLAYRGALRAAAEHGVLFATTFDLHRFDMLSAMHYALPTSVEKEHKLNNNLTWFLMGREPPRPGLAEYGYVHPQPEPPAQPADNAQPGTGDGQKTTDGGTGEQTPATPVVAAAEPATAETSTGPDHPDQ